MVNASGSTCVDYVRWSSLPSRSAQQRYSRSMPELLSPRDAKLVDGLRAGDEELFMELIRELNPSLLRVARMFVPTTAVAEDVVAETWLAVLN